MSNKQEPKQQPPIQPRDYLIWIPIMALNIVAVVFAMRVFGWRETLSNTLGNTLVGLLVLAAAFMLQYVENLLANKIRIALGKPPMPPLWVFTAYSEMWRDRNGNWY